MFSFDYDFVLITGITYLKRIVGKVKFFSYRTEVDIPVII
jgi:hypothetical protein